MNQIVYIDVLFVVNLFINYLILLTTAKVLNLSISRYRLIFGACLGGLYALLIFTPNISLVYSLLAKLLFSLSIILASFKKLSLKKALKTLVCFYGVSFLFAGAMFAILNIFNSKTILVNNGIVYFNISIPKLVIISFVVFILINFITKLSKKTIPDLSFYNLEIYVNNLSIKTRAFMDTGNVLKDSFSQTPVIIAEYEIIKDMVPENLKTFFNGKEKHTFLSSDENWSKKIRLIPFSSMGGEGLLPAFRPEKIVVSSLSKTYEVEDVLVAVCNKRMTTGEYFAILNPAIINENEKVVMMK